jgi:sterol 3beta-glucosyltransferase
MDVTLIAIGTRGDVQPMAALGGGLRRRGHTVRVLAGDEYRYLVEDQDLQYLTLGSPFASLMTGSNLAAFASRIRDRVVEVAQIGADAVVSTFLGVSSLGVARANGLPFFYALPIPSLRTSEFASPAIAPFSMGGFLNLLTHRMTERFVTRAVPESGLLLEEPRPKYLLSFSEHVVPRPHDWGAFAHVTGYWFLGSSGSWTACPELQEFCATDDPPIAVSFGSTLDDRLPSVLDAVIDAANQLSLRAVILGCPPRSGLPRSRFLFVDSAPHDWLFPRVRAAVHHGGAGTTAEVLRAGIPSVVVPFALDQPFWAHRIYSLGAGAKPVMPKYARSALGAALDTVMSNASYSESAKAIANKISSEDGVGVAVDAIEREAAS